MYSIILYIHGQVVYFVCHQSRTMLISQTISHRTRYGKLPHMLTILLHNAQAFPKFLEKNSIRLSRGQEGALRQHARHICRLSWELVTCWPPLISARPSEFKEEWQDREYQYWDKSLTKFRLSYTRPVLFLSYEGRVGVKGWVGNKEPVSGTGGGVRRTPPTERGRRRTGTT